MDSTLFIATTILLYYWNRKLFLVDSAPISIYATYFTIVKPMVPFSIGTYEDKVYYDVVLIYASHLTW